MAKKFYVVWAGRKTGIFTEWPTTKRSVEKFPGARYKSFPTMAEAEAAFGGGGRTAINPKGSVKKAVKGPVSNAEIQIYCDGGCEPNPGNAGSGVAVYRSGKLEELWYGLYNPMGTNNTAELNALHQALLIAERELSKGVSIEILSDSSYSIKCIKEWAPGWQRRGWTRPAGEIKNLDLIKPIFELYTRIKAGIALNHVKAHVGIEGNELADRMSIITLSEKERAFVRFPDTSDIEGLLKLRAG